MKSEATTLFTRAMTALAITASAALSGCGDLEDPPEEMPGLSCWDLNGNGELDMDEDLDGDGEATANDCRPAGGGESLWMSVIGGIVYDGNVGIGTIPVGNRLQVAGNVDAQGFSINGVPLSTSSDTYWSADANSNIYYSSGRVGIGTSNPDAVLDVEGTVRLVAGTPGDGKVLTSDAQGFATWQPLPAPPQEFQPQVMWVKGTTNAQTTGGGNWSELPEMSVMMTTSGRPVVVQFDTHFYGNGDFRLLVDGSEEVIISGYGRRAHLNWAGVPSAGTHTFTIEWRNVSDNEHSRPATYPNESRMMTVMEI